MRTRTLRGIQQMSFFGAILTVAVLLTAASAFADTNNSAKFTAGTPRQGGQIRFTLHMKRKVGGVTNYTPEINLDVNIPADANDVNKAARIKDAFDNKYGASNQADANVNGNKVDFRAKNGWEITGKLGRGDDTMEGSRLAVDPNTYDPNDSNLPPSDPNRYRRQRGLFSVPDGNAATGVGGGGGAGKVVVEAYGKTVTVNTYAGQTAAAIEDLVITEMISLGLTGTRLASAIDELDTKFPGAEGDGRVVLIPHIDSNGIGIDINDTGLALDVGGIIVLEGVLPATNKWGLIVMAVVLLSVGGYVLLKHKRTTATA